MNTPTQPTTVPTATSTTPAVPILVNLTKHDINIYDLEGKTLITVLKPSGIWARVDSENEIVHDIGGVILQKTTFGEVMDLPDPVDGVIYVASMLVRTESPHRKDLASPGIGINGPDGRPIGCKGLAINS